MTRSRFPRVLLGGLCLFALAAAAAAPKYGQKEPPPPETVVVKFEKAERQKYYGKDVMVVSGYVPLDKRQIQMAIPNEDEKSGKYKPRERLADQINALHPGDPAQFTLKGKDRETWVDKIESYKIAAGEEQPGNYVFDETYTKDEGKLVLTVVRVRKLAKIIDAIIPMKQADRKSEPVADAALIEQAGKFKKGDVVEAEFEANRNAHEPADPQAILLALAAYRAPEAAKMQKLGDSEVSGQAKYPTVELDQAGKTLNLPLMGKTQGKRLVPDPRLVSQVKAIKAGTEVMFRTREEGGTTYLREIEAAPKASAKNAAAPAATVGADNPLFRKPAK